MRRRRDRQTTYVNARTLFRRSGPEISTLIGMGGSLSLSLVPLLDSPPAVLRRGAHAADRARGRARCSASFLRGSPSWDIEIIYSQSGSSLDSRMSSMCGKLGALSAMWRLVMCCIRATIF